MAPLELYAMPRSTASQLAAPSSDAQASLARASANAERDSELNRLVVAIAEGDARAFESFYERTIHFTFAAARRVAGDAYAEDVLADAYFQAWRDASRFDGNRGSAVAWIITIVRTRALDRLRQENLRHGGLSGAPDFDDSSMEDEVVFGPEALLEHTQSKSALHSAINELSSNERWCLGLAYFRDHSHSEIAAITGLPLGSVKTHISRSQQKLRFALTGGSDVSVQTRSKECES